MDTLTELLFSTAGLAIAGLGALVLVAALLMWLARRQIRETT